MDDFDFFSEAFRYDPKAEYARMRTECPLARTSVPFDWYAVTLQADVQQMLRNYKLWSSEHGPGLAFAGGGALVSVDPPQHTSDRRLVQEAFNADTLLAMEPDIRQLVNDEMDKWVALGKGDLMELLGTPVPLIVIAWLLGLDVDYCREIRPRADGVISLHADGQSGQPPKERNANREEEIHYFRRKIAERRQMTSVKERAARMDEFVEVLRACWGPDPVSFDGRFFSIPPSIQRPKPLQQPHPLLVSGASSPAGRARTAAMFDGWNPAGRPVADVVADVAAMQAERKPDQPPLRVFYRTFVQFLGPQEPLEVTLQRLRTEVTDAVVARFDEVIIEHNFWNAIRGPEDWLAVPSQFASVLEAARGGNG